MSPKHYGSVDIWVWRSDEAQRLADRVAQVAQASFSLAERRPTAVRLSGISCLSVVEQGNDGKPKGWNYRCVGERKKLI